jgi:predicted dithiol-disulfide oxidoreductase (DUF899 family)
MRFIRLDETGEYRKRREELRRAEIDLIEHRERVAQLRRDLPPGPDRPLITYHLMFGKLQTKPCPTCTTEVAARWNELALLRFR